MCWKPLVPAASRYVYGKKGLSCAHLFFCRTTRTLTLEIQVDTAGLPSHRSRLPGRILLSSPSSLTAHSRLVKTRVFVRILGYRPMLRPLLELCRNLADAFPYATLVASVHAGNARAIQLERRSGGRGRLRVAVISNHHLRYHGRRTEPRECSI